MVSLLLQRYPQRWTALDQCLLQQQQWSLVPQKWEITPPWVFPYDSGSYLCRALSYSNAAPSATAGLRSTVVGDELGYHAPHDVQQRYRPILQRQLELAWQPLNFSRRIVLYVSLPLQIYWLLVLIADLKRSSHYSNVFVESKPGSPDYHVV